MSYVIGMDYGTDSVRAVLVRTKDGREINHAVYYYPRWRAGAYCDPANNQFRQHPLDYLEGLEMAILECLEGAPEGVPGGGLSLPWIASSSTFA